MKRTATTIERTEDVVCPYCRNTDIEANITENDYDGLYRQRVICHSCGKQWIDVYTLTGIEDMENDP